MTKGCCYSHKTARPARWRSLVFSWSTPLLTPSGAGHDSSTELNGPSAASADDEATDEVTIEPGHEAKLEPEPDAPSTMSGLAERVLADCVWSGVTCRDIGSK